MSPPRSASASPPAGGGRQAKKEESAEAAWRHLLADLSTTELVHVRLWRRGASGSFYRLGAIYNTDLDTVREREKLVPYGNGTNTPVTYMIEVARASDRVDNPKSWRKYIFPRVGPAPPEGWSLDSVDKWLDAQIEEVDVATLKEAFELWDSKRNQQQGVIPGQTVAVPPNPYGDPYFMRMEEERRRREEDDRRRREAEERRRIEEEWRRRDEAERRLREETKRREDEHRAQLAKIQADRDRDLAALNNRLAEISASQKAAEERAARAEALAAETRREAELKRLLDEGASRHRELETKLDLLEKKEPQKSPFEQLAPGTSR